MLQSLLPFISGGSGIYITPLTGSFLTRRFLSIFVSVPFGVSEALPEFPYNYNEAAGKGPFKSPLLIFR
jgi:hypothetical protein